MKIIIQNQIVDLSLVYSLVDLKEILILKVLNSDNIEFIKKDFIDGNEFNLEPLYEGTSLGVPPPLSRDIRANQNKFKVIGAADSLKVYYAKDYNSIEEGLNTRWNNFKDSVKNYYSESNVIDLPTVKF